MNNTPKVFLKLKQLTLNAVCSDGDKRAIQDD